MPNSWDVALRFYLMQLQPCLISQWVFTPMSLCLSGNSKPKASGAAKPSDQSALAARHQPGCPERLRPALPVASGTGRNDEEKASPGAWNKFKRVASLLFQVKMELVRQAVSLDQVQEILEGGASEADSQPADASWILGPKEAKELEGDQWSSANHSKSRDGGVSDDWSLGYDSGTTRGHFVTEDSFISVTETVA